MIYIFAQILGNIGAKRLMLAAFPHFNGMKIVCALAITLLVVSSILITLLTHFRLAQFVVSIYFFKALTYAIEFVLFTVFWSGAIER